MQSSTLSSELISTKTCVEDVQYFFYKMRIIGVPLLEGHANTLLCGNNLFWAIASRVGSVFKNKHSLVAYDAVIWGVMSGIVPIGWIYTN